MSAQAASPIPAGEKPSQLATMSQWQLIRRRFARHKLAAAALYILSFLYIMGGELTQSISDYEGDEAMGVRSMAIARGRRAAAVCATACYILTALAGAVTASLHGDGLEAYTLLIIVGTVAAVYLISSPLLRNPDVETAIAIRRRINYLAYLIITFLLVSSILTNR